MIGVAIGSDLRRRDACIAYGARRRRLAVLYGFLWGPGRDVIRALDLGGRRGHSRFGRRCSHFRRACVGVACGRQGAAGGASRPAWARWTRGGRRPGVSRVCVGALACCQYSRWGSDVDRAEGGETPSWYALPRSDGRGSDGPRAADGGKGLGGRQAAVPWRCSQRCPTSSPAAARVGLTAQPGPLPGALALALAPMFRCVFRWPRAWEQRTSELACFAQMSHARPRAPPGGQPAGLVASRPAGGPAGQFDGGTGRGRAGNKAALNQPPNDAACRADLPERRPRDAVRLDVAAHSCGHPRWWRRFSGGAGHEHHVRGAGVSTWATRSCGRERCVDSLATSTARLQPLRASAYALRESDHAHCRQHLRASEVRG